MGRRLEAPPSSAALAAWRAAWRRAAVVEAARVPDCDCCCAAACCRRSAAVSLALPPLEVVAASRPRRAVVAALAGCAGCAGGLRTVEPLAGGCEAGCCLPARAATRTDRREARTPPLLRCCIMRMMSENGLQVGQSEGPYKSPIPQN